MNKREKHTMDGNQAAAYVSYAYSEVAAIYPITPSTSMAELTDEWAAQDKKNIFGERVLVTELQSEAGAAGAVHGSLAAGALTTTFTASQGLLLMIPNLYKITGEMLPGVFHVAARALATHALSIFGDHSDVYACRQTGAAMLCSNGVQEVMDLAPVAHLCALEARLPFIHFFDGFRTSHEIQKVETWDYEQLSNMMDFKALQSFRDNALNPTYAKQMGSAQNPDVFFQAREASNTKYETLPAMVEAKMQTINEQIGTDYHLFSYYGAKDAQQVIVAMGSVCETAEETIAYLNEAGAKVGLVKVHLYRPFSKEHLLKAIPATVQKITVLDRTKEAGSVGEPLYLDVVAALRGSQFHEVPIFAGRYGLGSKDTSPEQIKAVFDNTEKECFTIGIEDDVTYLSLPLDQTFDSAPTEMVSCKFWGLGADGTVGANKNSIKIIGDYTPKYVQAYFDYDSKKSGGVTISHLRFGSTPIKSTYLVKKADFVACHNPSYLWKYQMVQDIKDGGSFLLNCAWEEKELEERLPSSVKKYLAKHKIRFYCIDGIRIGKEIGLNTRINTILQAAFFKIANIIPVEEAVKLMKEAASKSYAKKGEAVISMNHAAIDCGITEVREVQVLPEWAEAAEVEYEKKELEDREEVVQFVGKIQRVINEQDGNKLPVSALLPYADGSTPSGTSAHERRNVAVDIPLWKSENCIQCNRCAYVCPHAVIRPTVLDAKEVLNAPTDMKHLPMTGMPEYEFAIVFSPVDCTGCGVCAAVCPGMRGQKALCMVPINENPQSQEVFDYTKKLPQKEAAIAKFQKASVKGSQFCKPLLEFSGACAGCGETPYAKLVTQLFGERMYIANATGCSSIWGNSSPSTPYTTNAKGEGPAWSNSLFEDAAEFGYGMLLAQNAMRTKLKGKVIHLLQEESDGKLEDTASAWLESFTDGNKSTQTTEELVEVLMHSKTKLAKEILAEKAFLAKKSQWVFGGDGWAYDIGFGGLDHVLASGEDINIMVFDTEMYSNTGGQSSKATPMGSVAKFAAGGKSVKKKDLAAIAMSYGYVYVAQIAMGADFNQCVKAIAEAESYPGPSILIAYAPCISHGIKTGMNNASAEEEKAVKAGYWHCFRFDPRKKGKGESPFQLDSKEPVIGYQEFLEGEVRYEALRRADPDRAAILFEKAAQDAKERYEKLSHMEDYV